MCGTGALVSYDTGIRKVKCTQHCSHGVGETSVQRERCRNTSQNHYGLLTNGLDTSSVPKLLMETRLGFLHEHVTFHNIKLFTNITGL